MSSLNQVNLIGRVGRDPEMRNMPNGEATCSLSLATSEKWKDKNTGEQKEATEWHRCVFFGRLAEVVGQYAKKGGMLYVQGKITTRKYTDQGGVEKSITEVKCHEMKLLSSPGQEGGGQRAPAAAPAQAQRPAQRPQQGAGGIDDDLPF